MDKVVHSVNSQTVSHAAGVYPVSTDSRSIKRGDCFFALKGERFDGHHYVTDAFEKGAVCAVVSKNFKGLLSYQSCLLKVDDPKKTLGDLARRVRNKSKFKVVAITGSVGKTTTRHIIAHVLGRNFSVYQSPRNFNNDIGLPLTLLSAPSDTQIVIAELGSNHPGEIAYLAKIARPDIAVITNVRLAHLEGFGDLKTITQEKLSISEGLMPDADLIINGDDAILIERCRAKGISFVGFGTTANCNIRAEQIVCEHDRSRFVIEGTEVIVPLLGRGNIENALAAWAVCKTFDLKPEDFAQALQNLPPLPMRLQVRHLGRITVLDDSYNANPASMKNALDILSAFSSAKNARPVFICGDMAELGSESEKLHADLGADIAKAGVKHVVAVGPLAKLAAEAAKNFADYELSISCYEDTPSACDNLHKFIKDNDIVLVKGSRINALETAVEKLQQLFARL